MSYTPSMSWLTNRSTGISTRELLLLIFLIRLGTMKSYTNCQSWNSGKNLPLFTHIHNLFPLEMGFQVRTSKKKVRVSINSYSSMLFKLLHCSAMACSLRTFKISNLHYASKRRYYWSRCRFVTISGRRIWLLVWVVNAHTSNRCILILATWSMPISRDCFIGYNLQWLICSDV